MNGEWNSRFIVAWLMASAALWGCGSETEDPSQLGKVNLALTSTSSGGVNYGLLAEIRAEGPEDFVGRTDPFVGSFVREVRAGAYEVEP